MSWSVSMPCTVLPRTPDSTTATGQIRPVLYMRRPSIGTIEDELKRLRVPLARLQPGGGMILISDGKDVTASERTILEAEIRDLEAILKRLGVS